VAAGLVDVVVSVPAEVLAEVLAEVRAEVRAGLADLPVRGVEAGAEPRDQQASSSRGSQVLEDQGGRDAGPALEARQASQ
jgi:hypothetical protein